MYRAPMFNLYVSSLPDAKRFWQQILGCDPVEDTPQWAAFPVVGGGYVGLWSRTEVSPPVSANPPPASVAGQSGEIAFALSGQAQLDALFKAVSEQGVPVAQPPVQLDFGKTFVVLDPDGTRVRFYHPSDVRLDAAPSGTASMTV